MLSNIGSIASIIGVFVSFVIYFKINENKKFYLRKRHSEITKRRIAEIMSISDEKTRCTSSVKNEIESIINFYRQNYLPYFGKRKERKMIKELKRLVEQKGDTLPAIKQNLALIIANLECED
jgi:hypothetical protein